MLNISFEEIRKVSGELIMLAFVSVPLEIAQPQGAFSICGPAESPPATFAAQHDIFSIPGVVWQTELPTNG